MDCKEREKLKELERVKWKYWMQSDKFIEMWHFVHGCGEKINPPLPDQFHSIGDDTGRKWTHPMFFATREYWYYFILRKPEDGLRKPEDGCFEEYWDFMIKNIWPKFDESEEAQDRIFDYRKEISRDIDRVLKSFKSIENREPTIDELKDTLTNWLLEDDDVYLRIEQIDYSIAEAKKRSKQVYMILKDRTRPGKPEIKALRSYLEAYKLKTKDNKSYKDIFIKLNGEKLYEDPIRQVKKHIQNARQIIQNLESHKNPWWNLK